MANVTITLPNGTRQIVDENMTDDFIYSTAWHQRDVFKDIFGGVTERSNTAYNDTVNAMREARSKAQSIADQEKVDANKPPVPKNEPPPEPEPIPAAVPEAPGTQFTPDPVPQEYLEMLGMAQSPAGSSAVEPSPVPVEFTPEISEAFKEKLARPIRERMEANIGAKKREALTRGLVGEPWEASAVAAARGEGERELADLEATLGMRGAELAREERLAREGRIYGTGERLSSQAFAGGQAALGRQFENYQGALGRNFQSRLLGRQQEFQGSQAALDRAARERMLGLESAYRLQEYEQTKPQWWEYLLGAVGQVGGRYLGSKIG